MRGRVPFKKATTTKDEEEKKTSKSCYMSKTNSMAVQYINKAIFHSAYPAIILPPSSTKQTIREDLSFADTPKISFNLRSSINPLINPRAAFNVTRSIVRIDTSYECTSANDDVEVNEIIPPPLSADKEIAELPCLFDPKVYHKSEYQNAKPVPISQKLYTSDYITDGRQLLENFKDINEKTAKKACFTLLYETLNANHIEIVADPSKSDSTQSIHELICGLTNVQKIVLYFECTSIGNPIIFMETMKSQLAATFDTVSEQISFTRASCEGNSFQLSCIIKDASGNPVLVNSSQYTGNLTQLKERLQVLYHTNMKIEFHPLITKIELSEGMFADEESAFINYTSSVPLYKEHRGGLLYYFPLGWIGFGLKVRGKYDNGDNTWLDDYKNGWAIAYHAPDNDKQVIESIISKSLITTGTGQVYSSDYDTNQLSSQIGNKCKRGAYLSPHIEVCEQTYSHAVSIGEHKYKIIFQCRCNPSKVRIPEKSGDSVMRNGKQKCWDNDYWVVNESQCVRPYRILIKQIK